MSSSAGPESDALVRAAAGGDGCARAQLLDRYRARLRRMVAIRLDRRTAARIDPSDVVQEAMTAALVRLPEYFADPQIAFYPWLRRIAWDRLVDVYRTHISAAKRSVLKELSWVPSLSSDSVGELAQSIASSGTGPGERLVEAEMQARMKAALLELRPPDREVLVLRFLEQLSVAEIAGVLEISETAVSSRHLRALQRLRRLLGDETGNSRP